MLIMPERSRFQAYFDYIMGLPINLADDTIWNTVSDSEIAQNMACYPDRGAIAFFDDVMIVKLGPVTNSKMDFYQLPS